MLSRIRTRCALLCGVLLMAFVVESCDREAVYDNIKDFAGREEVYPAKFDTIYGRIGYERVEIDLRKDGRIPAGKIIMGKAQKTVVIYDEDMPTPVEIRIDSVCSYVSVTGLKEPRVYRFRIFTEDGYGNRSTPQEISLAPYTSYDRDVLQQGISDPTAYIASSALIMEWPGSLHSIMMEYHGMEYRYTDADNVQHSGSFYLSPRLYAANLPTRREVVFNMTYRLLPILADGRKLLDTLMVEKPFAVRMPAADQPFVPMELAILKANGIRDFTLEAADRITKLTYPMNMTTFADLFYFNNVDTLDLTGKGLPGTLETLTYVGGSATDGTRSMVGGGAWQEFMMPVDQPARIRQNTGRAPESLQTLKDAIEGGQISKVLYIPKTLGTAFDAFVQPYVQSGVVELLANSHPIFPDSVYVEPQFFGRGNVQDPNWNMNLSYSGDFLPRQGFADIGKFNPAGDVVNGQPVNLHLDQLLQSDGKNIYRGVAVGRAPTFIFALPREWRFDNQRYPYVKFKMFIGCDKSLVTNVGGNNRHIYRQPWLRPMNRLWGFPNNSDYGQEYWNTDRLASMTDTEIQTSWREYTVNLSLNDGGDNSNRRNRVYAINIGHEDGVTWTYNANSQVVIYIADFRLCKTVND